MTKIISISSPKGGVGKTSVTINLGASLAVAERKVLIIDFDTSAAVSYGLGLEDHSLTAGLYEFLLGISDDSMFIHHYELPPFDFIPNNILSNNREKRLMETLKNRGVLKKKFDTLIRTNTLNYDYILIDTPPLLNEYTLLALSISDSLIVPIRCGYYSIRSVDRILQTLKRIQSTINSKLTLEGILFNFYEKRTRETQWAVQMVKNKYSNSLFKTRIPKNVAIGISLFKHKPVVLYDALSPGAQAFMALAQEILNKHTPQKKEPKSIIIAD